MIRAGPALCPRCAPHGPTGALIPGPPAGPDRQPPCWRQAPLGPQATAGSSPPPSGIFLMTGPSSAVRPPHPAPWPGPPAPGTGSAPQGGHPLPGPLQALSARLDRAGTGTSLSRPPVHGRAGRRVRSAPYPAASDSVAGGQLRPCCGNPYPAGKASSAAARQGAGRPGADPGRRSSGPACRHGLEARPEPRQGSAARDVGAAGRPDPREVDSCQQRRCNRQGPPFRRRESRTDRKSRNHAACSPCRCRTGRTCARTSGQSRPAAPAVPCFASGLPPRFPPPRPRPVDSCQQARDALSRPCRGRAFSGLGAEPEAPAAAAGVALRARVRRRLRAAAGRRLRAAAP